MVAEASVADVVAQCAAYAHVTDGDDLHNLDSDIRDIRRLAGGDGAAVLVAKELAVSLFRAVCRWHDERVGK